MIIFKISDQLSEFIRQQKKTGIKIAFIPTMGALHQGHLQLVKKARELNALTICSIFVNPTQFNNAEDFRQYPTTIEKDVAQLVETNCDVLFLPPVAEIYPEGYQKKHYELGLLETMLEGKYRPGHFQGVCQVVDRLLGIIQPEDLFLGQKDFQQCMVIKKLVQLTERDGKIKLNIIPTIRESDGLAMSSRNLRLNEEQRQLARSIFAELSFIKENINSRPLPDLKSKAKEHLEKKGFKVDYVEIANVHDLSPATDYSVPLIALAAAAIGKIRLIDNLLLN